MKLGRDNTQCRPIQVKGILTQHTVSCRRMPIAESHVTRMPPKRRAVTVALVFVKPCKTAVTTWPVAGLVNIVNSIVFSHLQHIFQQT